MKSMTLKARAILFSSRSTAESSSSTPTCWTCMVRLEAYHANGWLYLMSRHLGDCRAWSAVSVFLRSKNQDHQLIRRCWYGVCSDIACIHSADASSLWVYYKWVKYAAHLLIPSLLQHYRREERESEFLTPEINLLLDQVWCDISASLFCNCLDDCYAFFFLSFFA